MIPPEEETRKRIPSGCSVGRIINLLIAFVYLLIVVTSIVVIGILGYLSSELQRYPDREANASVACPLFVYCEDTDASCQLRYNGGPACAYVEVSFGLIAFFALVCIVFQVIRALFQANLGFTVLIDLPAIVICGLVCFAASVTLSVGGLYTCDQVRRHYTDDTSGSCDKTIPNVNGLPYYNSVNAAQGGAWFCFLFIMIILVVDIIRIIIFWRRRIAGVPMNTDESSVLTAQDDVDAKPV